MTKIGESTLYSIVTPGGILSRHAEYQIGDLLREARPTWSLPGIGPLLRDELPVPGEQTYNVSSGHTVPSELQRQLL